METPKKKSSNKVIIIIVAAVLLCLCSSICIGASAYYYYSNDLEDNWFNPDDDPNDDISAGDDSDSDEEENSNEDSAPAGYKEYTTAEFTIYHPSLFVNQNGFSTIFYVSDPATFRLDYNDNLVVVEQVGEDLGIDTFDKEGCDEFAGGIQEGIQTNPQYDSATLTDNKIVEFGKNDEIACFSEIESVISGIGIEIESSYFSIIQGNNIYTIGINIEKGSTNFSMLFDAAETFQLN